MPIRKKHSNHNIRKFLIWAILIVLITLMIISFAPTQHINEIVVFS